MLFANITIQASSQGGDWVVNHPVEKKNINHPLKFSLLTNHPRRSIHFWLRCCCHPNKYQKNNIKLP